MAEHDWMRLIYLLLLLLLIGPVLFTRIGRKWLPYTAVWLAVLAALVFIYQTFGPF